MHSIEITIKNEKKKIYKLIIFLFIVLQVILMIYFLSDHLLQNGFIIGVIVVADILMFRLAGAALQNTRLRFNDTGIEKTNFPAKHYTWQQFSNVILKDSVLTLDFKNNKFFQAEIDTATANEDAFNTFAKAQLVKV